MAESPAAAPAAPAAEPTKIPPPVAAGPNGSAAMADGAKPAAPAVDPLEFDLDVKGQKQKIKFANTDQLKAVLQKALYADQAIKDGVQARKGAEALMQKLKTEEGLREVLTDPEIGHDIKGFALKIVREMMDDEKLTPEQRQARDAIRERDALKAEKEQRLKSEEERKKAEKLNQRAVEARTQIIEAMKKYPDIPQTQATMDAVIQNMRAAFRRFGKHLTPDQAMTVYSQQYWGSFLSTVEKMSDDQIKARFGDKAGQKLIDRLENIKLAKLKDKMNPAKKAAPAGSEAKRKNGHMSEKEFDRNFQQKIGLAGL